MGVGVGLGKGLAGCGGILGAGLGLGCLVEWRGHFDGMTVGGGRESWKIDAFDSVVNQGMGVRFESEEVGCLSMFVLRGRQVGVQYWELSSRIRSIHCPLRIITGGSMLTNVEWLTLEFYFLYVVYSSQLQYAQFSAPMVKLRMMLYSSLDSPG